MPHLHRFHVPPDTPLEGALTLSGEEAHHGLRVVRVRKGEEVALFDGRGREARAEVTGLDRHELHLEVRDVREQPPPSPELHLAVAWLQHDKPIEFLIRHGTELGVSRFDYFRAAHSQRAPRPQAKWEKLAIESCKQCGRLWLPEFRVHDTFDEALAATEGTLLLATMAGEAIPLSRLEDEEARTVFIGPEGDFTAHEVEAALDRGAEAVSLGEVTYRSEVAAVLFAALLQYESGLLGPRQ